MAAKTEKLPFWLEAEGVKWQHKDDYNSWKDYSAKLTKQCEAAYRKMQSGDNTGNVFEYTGDNGNTIKVDVKNLQQRNMSGYYGYRRQMRRQGPKLPKKGRPSDLTKLFNRYKDGSKDAIGYEGIIKFLEACGVNVNADDGGGIDSFIIPGLFGANSLMEWTKAEFTEGFANVGCSSLSDIKRLFADVARKIKSNNKVLTCFYRWLFQYVCEDKKKSIPKETAVYVWQTILGPMKLPLLKMFIKFVEKSDQYNVISRDPWCYTLEFLLSTSSVKDFEDDGSWPLIIDDFIEFTETQ